jgi:hypothetical protein
MTATLLQLVSFFFFKPFSLFTVFVFGSAAARECASTSWKLPQNNLDSIFFLFYALVQRSVSPPLSLQRLQSPPPPSLSLVSSSSRS